MFKLTTIEKIRLAANIVKGATVTLVSSAALSEANPYVIVAISLIGGAADKILSLIKRKETES